MDVTVKVLQLLTSCLGQSHGCLNTPMPWFHRCGNYHSRFYPLLSKVSVTPLFLLPALQTLCHFKFIARIYKNIIKRLRELLQLPMKFRINFRCAYLPFKSLLLFSPLQRQPLFPSLPHHIHVLFFHIHFHHTLDSSLSQTQPLLSLAKLFSLQLPALVTAFHWTLSL